VRTHRGQGVDEESFVAKTFVLGLELRGGTGGGKNSNTLCRDTEAGTSEESDRLFGLPDPLPPLTNGLPEEVLDAGAFMIRDCYEEYFNAIMERLKIKGNTRLIITGSPGIGKSLFFLYFGEKLKNEKLAQYLIMATMAFDDKLLVWDVVANTWSRMDWVNVKERFDGEKNAWLLVDGPDKGDAFYKRFLQYGKTVWFLSPNKKIIRPLLSKNKARIYYMPVWSFQELMVCNQLLYKIEEKNLLDRYRLFGGIPREIFDANQAEARGAVEEALQVSQITKNLHYLAKLNCFMDQFSHKLLVLQPIGLNQYKLKFASRQIEDKVLHGHNEALPRDFAEFIRVTKGSTISAATRGHVLERLAHAMLCCGGDFKVRDLSSGQLQTVNFKRQIFRVCRSDKEGNNDNDHQGSTLPISHGGECPSHDDSRSHLGVYPSNENTCRESSSVCKKPYFLPKSKNQGGFDAFNDDYFFQMTVSRSKAVNVSYFEKSLEQRQLPLPGADQQPLKLMYVVSDDIFSEFKPFKKFKYHSQQLPSWSKHIQQYVLCIPTDAAAVESFKDLHGFLEQVDMIYADLHGREYSAVASMVAQQHLGG
jgi:hypothetical protein